MGRLRFVFRHFPLEEVHPHALLAAQAAEAAAGQRGVVCWPVHEILFDHMHALKARHLREYAQRPELDLPRFASDLGDNIYLPRIRAYRRGRMCVRAVPTFFVNSALFDVSFEIRPLFDAVEEACGQEVERTLSMR